MKRLICLFLALLLCGSTVICAHGKTYTISGTDIFVDIDDSIWYVFTRDNIENNPELDELGITTAYMQELFEENWLYLDATVFLDEGDYIELFVRKKSILTKFANLSECDSEEVEEFAERLQMDYRVYDSGYTFILVDYTDTVSLEHAMYLCEFYTVVNKESYILTFQSPTPFSEDEYEHIYSIVDSVRFTLKDTDEGDSDSGSTILKSTVIGAAVGGISGLIGTAITKKKKAKEKKKTEE